jgi:hypothetical protein
LPIDAKLSCVLVFTAMSTVAEKISAYWQSNLTDLTEKKSLFIAGMRECGTVLDAADRADISRQTAYEWRRADPGFRNDWDAAKADADDKVKRSLFNQAVSERNVVATIFWLKNNCADYRDRIQVDLQAVDKEIEDRLGELLPPSQPATSLASHSTKEIIAEVLNTKRQLPAPISPDDTIT